MGTVIQWKTLRMNIALVFLAIVELALGAPKDLDIKEFEKKFNEKFEDKHMEKYAADILEKNEAQIDEENEKFEKGEANFSEKLQPWSDEPKEEFEKEKEGVIPHHKGGDQGGAEWDGYYRGLIRNPETYFNTPEEKRHLKEVFKALDKTDLPSEYHSPYVTPITDQGYCGSCCAFATSGAVESCMLKAGAPATGLDTSEQQLLDCSYGQFYAKGCDGGHITSYTNYIMSKDSIGINHEMNYPYMMATEGQCKKDIYYWNSGAKVVDQIKKYVATDDEIKFLVYNYGHAITAIYASDGGFSSYDSGVFDTCSPTCVYDYHEDDVYCEGCDGVQTDNLRCNEPHVWANHAVVITGWGTENGIDYWKVRNSWGSDWGDNGYIKVKRGTCGVSEVAVALVCEANGTPDPIPDPTLPPAPEPCDVNHWWIDITGDYYLNTIGPLDGIQRKKFCKCQHGLCTPTEMESDQNSCEVLCGVDPCSLGKTFFIFELATGKALDATDKGDVILYPYHGNDNQLWSWNDVNKTILVNKQYNNTKLVLTTQGNYFSIIEQATGKGLDATFMGDVILYAYHGNDNQLWSWKDVAKTILRNKHYNTILVFGLNNLENCENWDWVNDNECDDGNNNAGCHFDGGDCCGDNVNTRVCKECECKEVGKR